MPEWLWINVGYPIVVPFIFVFIVFYIKLNRIDWVKVCLDLQFFFFIATLIAAAGYDSGVVGRATNKQIDYVNKYKRIDDDALKKLEKTDEYELARRYRSVSDEEYSKLQTRRNNADGTWPALLPVATLALLFHGFALSNAVKHRPTSDFRSQFNDDEKRIDTLIVITSAIFALLALVLVVFVRQELGLFDA
jgi:hypothetical protein